MRKIPIFASALFLAVAAAGCGGRDSASQADAAASATSATSAAPADPQAEPIVIERFDRAVMAYDSLDRHRRDSIAEAYTPVLLFLGGDNFNVDRLMSDIRVSQAQKVFGPDVERYLPDLSSIETSLGQLRANMSRELPGLQFPRHIYGIVTPYAQSIVAVADTSLLLGLNHYLGASYPGYQGYVENYMLPLKEPRRVVYDVAEALISMRYPYAETDGSTLLGRMLYDGAILAAMLRTVPGSTLQSVMGYTDEQMRWAADNERAVWSELARRQLLYSTDPSVGARLMRPAPSSALLTPDAPGRIGRYMGYRLIESYLRHNPEESPAGFLADSLWLSPSTLRQSGYGR